jgi:hypothetical protein
MECFCSVLSEIVACDGTHMNQSLDDLFKSSGIFFLPWIGDEYQQGFCGRKFLVLGESHYVQWDAADHELEPTFTRECIQEVVSRQDGARFWKSMEQALLNERREDGWCPGGGLGLWNKFAFYQYVQFPIAAGPRVSPTDQQSNDSLSAFTAVLEALRPERVLVCGKRLWGNMGPTKQQFHPCVEAYELSDGSPTWCLAIDHPSSGRFSWSKAHQLVKAFLNDPRDAATLLDSDALRKTDILQWAVNSDVEGDSAQIKSTHEKR